MPIIKDYMNQSFWQMDKDAFKILSHNAIIVYLTFVSIDKKINPTNEFMAKQCNMSLGTYKAAKKELIDNGYLHVQRMGAKGAIIVYHFGKQAVKFHFEEQERKRREKYNN